jgi:autotransporter translocation and assembly factor TamB
MNLALEGAIPLKSMVPFLLPDADMWGDIKISAKMAGTLKQPDLNADLALDRLGISLPESGQRLHDLTGHVRITPEALNLEKITGGLDQGTFSLAGTVALEKFKPHSWNIKATALQLPVKIPDTLDLLLESNLEFDGNTDKTAGQAAGQSDVRGDIRGEIRILEGLYYKDVKLNLLQGIREPKRTGVPDSSTGEMSFMQGLTLDIGIQSRQPVQVDNNVAVMELVPALRLSGTLDNPVVSGRAQADEGVITYQKTEFEIQRAVIDFVNPYRIEPDMDIQATADVRDWTVMLHILGTPENLMFELTSTPPLEHGDILSLLLFKKTVGELTKGSSGASFSVEQGVADLVAEKLSAGVRDATGLDTVALKYSEGAGEASDDIGVTLGKELSRRISVQYEARTQKGETIQQASTEYRLLENLLMSAFQDTAGNFGGELTFRLEFR